MDTEGKETTFVGDRNCDFKNTANANAKQLKLVYSEYQLEQLNKMYTRIAVTRTALCEQRLSKSLNDHFSNSSSKYIIETGILETGMVDHY